MTPPKGSKPQSGRAPERDINSGFAPLSVPTMETPPTKESDTVLPGLPEFNLDAISGEKWNEKIGHSGEDPFLGIPVVQQAVEWKKISVIYSSYGKTGPPLVSDARADGVETELDREKKKRMLRVEDFLRRPAALGGVKKASDTAAAKASEEISENEAEADPAEPAEPPHEDVALLEPPNRDVAMFVSLLVYLAKFQNTFYPEGESVEGGLPWLWSLIYPQKDSEPVFNALGKYVVRLRFDGKDRKIVIDDTLAFAENGSPLYASSTFEDPEMWPALLMKALYRVTGGLPLTPHAISHLTGWTMLEIPTASSHFCDVVGAYYLGVAKSRKEPILAAALCTSSADGLYASWMYTVHDVRDAQGHTYVHLECPVRPYEGPQSCLDEDAWTPELEHELDYVIYDHKQSVLRWKERLDGASKRRRRRRQYARPEHFWIPLALFRQRFSSMYFFHQPGTPKAHETAALVYDTNFVQAHPGPFAVRVNAEAPALFFACATFPPSRDPARASITKLRLVLRETQESTMLADRPSGDVVVALGGVHIGGALLVPGGGRVSLVDIKGIAPRGYRMELFAMPLSGVESEDAVSLLSEAEYGDFLGGQEPPLARIVQKLVVPASSAGFPVRPFMLSRFNIREPGFFSARLDVFGDLARDAAHISVIENSSGTEIAIGHEVVEIASLEPSASGYTLCVMGFSGKEFTETPCELIITGPKAEIDTWIAERTFAETERCATFTSRLHYIANKDGELFRIVLDLQEAGNVYFSLLTDESLKIVKLAVYKRRLDPGAAAPEPKKKAAQPGRPKSRTRTPTGKTKGAAAATTPAATPPGGTDTAPLGPDDDNGELLLESANIGVVDVRGIFLAKTPGYNYVLVGSSEAVKTLPAEDPDDQSAPADVVTAVTPHHCRLAISGPDASIPLESINLDTRRKDRHEASISAWSAEDASREEASAKAREEFLEARAEKAGRLAVQPRPDAQLLSSDDIARRQQQRKIQKKNAEGSRERLVKSRESGSAFTSRLVVDARGKAISAAESLEKVRETNVKLHEHLVEVIKEEIESDKAAKIAAREERIEGMKKFEEAQKALGRTTPGAKKGRR